MASIYSAPKEIQLPAFNFRDIEAWRKSEAEYIEKVKEFCKKHSKDKSEYVGEMISFPHADGKAFYMVFSLKPLRLVHIPIGDAWESPYADLLNKQRVIEMIEADRKMAQLFNRKS